MASLPHTSGKSDVVLIDTSGRGHRLRPMSYPDFLIDKRVLQRNIQKGIVDPKEHQKNLQALPDVASNAQVCTPDPEEEPKAQSTQSSEPTQSAQSSEPAESAQSSEPTQSSESSEPEAQN